MYLCASCTCSCAAFLVVTKGCLSQTLNIPNRGLLDYISYIHMQLFRIYFVFIFVVLSLSLFFSSVFVWVESCAPLCNFCLRFVNILGQIIYLRVIFVHIPTSLTWHLVGSLNGQLETKRKWYRRHTYTKWKMILVHVVDSGKLEWT